MPNTRTQAVWRCCAVSPLSRLRTAAISTSVTAVPGVPIPRVHRAGSNGIATARLSVECTTSPPGTISTRTPGNTEPVRLGSRTG